MNEVVDHHNDAAGEIVKRIVKDTEAAGGDFRDVMILLESVAAGVIMVLVREEGDNPSVDLLAEGVKARLKDMRARRHADAKLAATPPQGTA